MLQQRAGGARYFRDGLTVDASVAVVLMESYGIVQLGEEREAGDDERFARQESAARLLRFGHAGLRSDIAGADIFFERDAHDGGHDNLASCAS